MAARTVPQALCRRCIQLGQCGLIPREGIYPLRSEACPRWLHFIAMPDPALTSAQPDRPAHVVSVDLAKAYRLINHAPTVLVSAGHGPRRNVMAAAWNMPLDFAPPKVAVVIDRK